MQGVSVKRKQKQFLTKRNYECIIHVKRIWRSFRMYITVRYIQQCNTEIVFIKSQRRKAHERLNMYIKVAYLTDLPHRFYSLHECGHYLSIQFESMNEITVLSGDYFRKYYAYAKRMFLTVAMAFLLQLFSTLNVFYFLNRTSKKLLHLSPIGSTIDSRHACR